MRGERGETSPDRSSAEAATPIVWIQVEGDHDTTNPVLCLLHEGNVPSMCADAHNIMQYMCGSETVDVCSSWNVSKENEDSLRRGLLDRMNVFVNCGKDESGCPFFTVARSSGGHIALGCGGPNVRVRTQVAKLAMAIAIVYYRASIGTADEGSNWFPAAFTELVGEALETGMAFEQNMEGNKAIRSST